MRQDDEDCISDDETFNEKTSPTHSADTSSVPKTTVQLYEGSVQTAYSSSVLLLQYKMRHRLTDEALEDLLQIIQMHCPSPNQCPTSVYKLNKFFPQMTYQIELHHFCSQCRESIDSESKNNACNNKLETSNDISAFIEVPS